MDLQAVKLMHGARPQWARLSALLLFAIAGALLVSSLTDGTNWRQGGAMSLAAHS